MAKKKDYSDFEDMGLNPFAIPMGKGMDHYKMFKNKAFWKLVFDESNYESWPNTDIDTLIKFVVLLVDPESPYYDERNFDIRVEKCCRILEIETKRGHVLWDEISSNGDLLTNIVFEFFRRINSHVYETWFSMKMNIHQLNMYLRQQPKGDKNGNVAADINARRQLSQVIPELTFELIEMEMQLFPDERLQKIINMRSSEDGLGGYAEQHAEEPRYNT